MTLGSTCRVTHEQAFQCLLNNKCLSKVQIHRKTKLQSRLQSTYIVASEGSKYQKLFKDCDGNNDGCLDMSDILTTPTCKRRCRWYETIAELSCPK